MQKVLYAKYYRIPVSPKDVELADWQTNSQLGPVRPT